MSHGTMKLTKICFDSMENHNPVYTEEIGIFADDEKATAFAKIGKWLKDNGPFDLFLGYDDQVYPKFRAERVILR